MLARSVLLAAIVGLVSAAEKLEGFPASVSCKLGTGGTAAISKAEMQKAIVGPKGTLVDNSASNVASGACVSLKGIPLFAADVTGKGSVQFAFDKAKDTYHFCSATGAIENGFPSVCASK
ncbi:hypothetical protein CMUS01_10378 [Colletotrichum musicola]|uniref:Uncharacterized protein n=1 Tax=Colletotrichum musicola TaxID=2175873 RepID=A0A8H6K4B2_9PEZI|nr:hypothetical protein CMUS01_10378 [Colletotrichum musicola]